MWSASRAATFSGRPFPPSSGNQKIDAVVCNGENSAVGNGILPHSADFLFDSGVDVITGGNHSLRRREIQDYLDDHPNLLRPANYPDGCCGNGWYKLDLGSATLLVISVLGQVYLEPIGSPFACCDRILKEVSADFTVVDFHAEATGEKMALGYYLDGRVSAVAGPTPMSRPPMKRSSGRDRVHFRPGNDRTHPLHSGGQSGEHRPPDDHLSPHPVRGSQQHPLQNGGSHSGSGSQNRKMCENLPISIVIIYNFSKNLLNFLVDCFIIEARPLACLTNDSEGF